MNYRTSLASLAVSLWISIAVGQSGSSIPEPPGYPPHDTTAPHSSIHVGGQNGVDLDLPGGGMDVQELAVMGMFFGFALAMLAITFYFQNRRNRRLHETLRTMIEKGVPIPPELLMAHNDGARPPRQARNDLQRALVMLALGGGIAVLWGKVGIIPALIGVAFLIVWIVDKSERKNEPKNS